MAAITTAQRHPTHFIRNLDGATTRFAERMRSGKVNVLFKPTPIEFKRNSVVLDLNGIRQEIPNDYVWIFAGGEPPAAFLKKISVGFGMRDVTAEAGKEAEQTMRARLEPTVTGSAC